MSQSNIEKFDYYAGVILARLYEAFPFEIDLDTQAMADELASKNPQPKGSDELAFVGAVLDFLLEYDFIKASPLVGGSFSDVRLTLKGLGVLKSVPPSIDQKHKSNGELLKQAAQSGAKSLLANATQALISTYIQSFKF
ncbi:hypothetical protein [Campylobacter sp. 19-13652]|uniref:hypothetical protein n=1 Tax=Campylobacter sp. 19-13652 TaxID=2840180 RepID=UPI001C775D23|nr:hypothetical protein [Campylobacter sp. 19-13652]BCX79245.1 hypothetical protein LBC_07070 [Campylobacter sp. 19-13652]